MIGRAHAKDYQTRLYLVNASDFGVPQRRKRLVVLGVKDFCKKLPDNLTDALPEHFDTTPCVAGEVFKRIGQMNLEKNSLHRARKSTPRVASRIRAIPIGGTRFDLPEDQVLKCHKNLKTRGAAASYGRIKLDQYAPTLTTRCTTPACGSFIHPEEHRGITLLEAAMLQTFPENYEFHGNYGDIERQIGNALPVRLAEALGHIAKSLCNIADD